MYVIRIVAYQDHIDLTKEEFGFSHTHMGLSAHACAINYKQKRFKFTNGCFLA